jgi:hypothetical protein
MAAAVGGYPTFGERFPSRKQRLAEGVSASMSHNRITGRTVEAETPSIAAQFAART